MFSIAAAPDGDIFVANIVEGVRRYRARQDLWEPVANDGEQFVACNADSVFIATRIPFQYHDYGDLDFPPGGGLECGLEIHSLGDGRRLRFGEDAAIPQPGCTAIALDGEDVWVGGSGFIGVINPKQKTMRKFCYMQARYVYHLEIADDCVWAQLYSFIYRIPLSVAR